MVENRKKHRQNSHPIIHCPTSEGVSEVSERVSEAEVAGGASERTSEWPSTTVWAVFDHSVIPKARTRTKGAYLVLAGFCGVLVGWGGVSVKTDTKSRG